MIKRRSQKQLAPKTDPDSGLPLVREDNQSYPAVDDAGSYVEADPETPGAITKAVDEFVPVRRGPAYRNVSLRDFLMLPAHAQDDSEVWCYAKRFWRRLKELQYRGKTGLYDKDAIEKLAATSDRTRTELPQAVQQSGVDVAAQSSPTTIEKELWELHVPARPR